MIRKAITTLGIVLLAIGMFSCESDSVSVLDFVAVTEQAALTAGNIDTYTVTLNKAVESVAGVTLEDQITLTRIPATGTGGKTSVSTATISGKNIALTFAETTFEAGDKLKIDIAAGAIQDTTADKTKNLLISVTVTVGAATVSGPDFVAPGSQEALTAGNIGTYKVTLDKAVESVQGVTLKDKITLTHTSGSNTVPTTFTAAVIDSDPTKIQLTFDAKDFVADDTLKIDIAAGAIQDTTSATTQNADISVTVTVGAATASGPDFAAVDSQAKLRPGDIGTYTVLLDKDVEVVDATSGFLTGKFTLTHTLADGTPATPANPSVTNATITDATIALEFAQTTFVANDTLKIDLAEGAIKDTTAAETQNSEIDIIIKVVDPPTFAATQASRSRDDHNPLPEYTVALDEAVRLVPGVILKDKITLKYVHGGVVQPPPTLANAEIDGIDPTKIKLTFTSPGIFLLTDDTLKIDLAEGAIQDVDSNMNSLISVTITAGPGFEETVTLYAGTAVTGYQLMISGNVELVQGVDLASKISLTHTPSGSAGVGLSVSTAVINANDQSLIDLTFPETDFATGDKLKVEIGADAIQTVTGKYKNSAISVEVTVVAAPLPGPDFVPAQQQGALYVNAAATTYTVTLDKNVAEVPGISLQAAIAVTHGLSGGSAPTTPDRSVTGATISGDTIELTFASTDLALGDTLKIAIAANSIQDTATPAIKNFAEITTTVTVVAAPASGPAFAAVDSQASLSPSTITEYTVTLDKEVEFADGVTTATDLAGKFTLTHTATATSAETSPDVSAAEIDTTDAKLIKLTFDSTILASDDTLKIDIEAGAIKDTTTVATNSDITVTVTANGPGFAATQDIPAKQTPVTAYTVTLDKEVELVDATTLGFLGGKMTQIHTHHTTINSLRAFPTTIQSGDKTKIDLVFGETIFFSGDTLKIEIAADAIQTVTGKYKNSAISTVITIP